MKHTLFTMLLLMAFGAQAQEKISNDSGNITGIAYPHTGKPVPCAGSANMQTLDLNWKPVLEKKISEIEHPVPDEEYLDSLKAAKLTMVRNYKQSRHTSAERTTSVLPQVGPNFSGNTHNGMTPLDNSVAIANNGNIVSVSNHSIGYYNTDGTNLYFRDIVSFLPGSFGVSAVCDPVVIYDVRADRFVFFCQEYSTSFSLFSNNRIFICFSKSNDPNTDGWWCYAITGDATGNGDAFDYPKLAYTDSEIYISGNLFYEPANTFHQAILYQMYKYPCYAGSSLNYLYYNNLNSSPFTVLPVSCGQDIAYGPGIYCVSTHASSGSDIDLYKVTANACCGPVITHSNVPTTAFSASANAAQSGTACLLNTGDCRALSGFYLNNIIHFVFNCDGGSGYTSINYNRLNPGTLTNISSTFGLSGYDYAYPSVVSFATTASDESVMIGFARSGSSIFPEIRVVNCDAGMNWSGSTLVQSSTSYVACNSSASTTRWGDYSGTSRWHSSSTQSIWMSGAYGDAANAWDTWIAEINPPGVGVNPVSKVQSDAKVYPNPVFENFKVEFSLDEATTGLNISITDMNGRLVRELYSGKAYQGDNVFSFNKANLSNGIYMLYIRIDSKIIKDEKIVIAH